MGYFLYVRLLNDKANDGMGPRDYFSRITKWYRWYRTCLQHQNLEAPFFA